MTVLEAVLRVAREQPPKIVRGDALVELPGLMSSVPRVHALCILSTFTLNQFTAAQRETLDNLLEKTAMGRELNLVSIEYDPSRRGQSPELRVVHLKENEGDDTLLARCEPHGEWIEWLLRDC
jgi:hypothetical protein